MVGEYHLRRISKLLRKNVYKPIKTQPPATVAAGGYIFIGSVFFYKFPKVSIFDDSWFLWMFPKILIASSNNVEMCYALRYTVFRESVRRSIAM